MQAREVLKIDFPPFLHILLHMIDFMSDYKFIICIINVLHKSYKTYSILSFLYVCMVNTIYLLSFVETPIINLRGVSTKLNKYTPYFNTICLKLVLNKKSLCAKILKSGFLKPTTLS